MSIFRGSGPGVVSVWREANDGPPAHRTFGGGDGIGFEDDTLAERAWDCF